MTIKRRITAGAMCLALLFVLFLSAAYIMREANHDCSGEACPICHEIQICQQLLNVTGTAAICCAFFCFAPVFVTMPRPIRPRDGEAITLISLKVKLSD